MILMVFIPSQQNKGTLPRSNKVNGKPISNLLVRRKTMILHFDP